MELLRIVGATGKRGVVRLGCCLRVRLRIISDYRGGVVVVEGEGRGGV